MRAQEVPAELVALLDEAAGREHSESGGVRTALAAILTRYREMVLAEARQGAVEGGPVVHGCPPNGSGLTSCCGRSPAELPAADRLTSHWGLVTCSRPPGWGRWRSAGVEPAG